MVLSEGNFVCVYVIFKLYCFHRRTADTPSGMPPTMAEMI